MHAKGVVEHVVTREMLKVHVQLVNARWVVHVGHDLPCFCPTLLKNLLAALGVECFQHRHVLTS